MNFKIIQIRKIFVKYFLFLCVSFSLFSLNAQHSNSFDNKDKSSIVVSKEDYLKQIESLKKEKLAIPSSDKKLHKSIEDEISIIQDKIDDLKY